MATKGTPTPKTQPLTPNPQPQPLNQGAHRRRLGEDVGGGAVEVEPLCSSLLLSSLDSSDTIIFEASMRTLLGTAPHFFSSVFLRLRMASHRRRLGEDVGGGAVEVEPVCAVVRPEPHRERDECLDLVWGVGFRALSCALKASKVSGASGLMAGG